MNRLLVPEKYDQIFELYLIIGRGDMETDLKWCQKRFDKMCKNLTSNEKSEFKELQIAYHIYRYKTINNIPKEYLIKI